MHLQVVIDDGSNFIKTAHKEDGKIILNSFPSRVVRAARMGEDFNVSNATYNINGSVYSVDESGADVIPTDKRAYQSSEANRVLIHHALRMMKATTADIILTLPVSQFFNEGLIKNTENIEAKKSNALGEITAADGGPCCEIKSIIVMPEGIPAFKYIRSSKKLEKGGYLVADIGGTTTDMVLFNPNNQIVSFKSLPIGALAVLNKFKGICVATIGNDAISDAHTMHGLLVGTLGGHDLSGHAAECIKGLSDLIADNIGALGDVSLLDGVFYSGGGAKLLNIGTTKDPQFDNVNGCIDLFKEK